MRDPLIAARFARPAFHGGPMPSSKLQPALLGGLLLGVLSALPLVNIANACCCLWVLAGGVVAAYLLQRNQSAPISSSDGALVGLGAGLIGAVVWQILSVPVSIVMAPLQSRLIERLLDAGDLPENTRQVFEMLRENSRFTVGRFVLGGFFVLAVSMIFSTLGGLLGATLFRSKVTPPPPPPPPPDLPWSANL
jgi:hypothetical protein